MKYTNEKCQVCNNDFQENDDIVVCPICGTPYHRDCYSELGHCINEEKHSEGFEWLPSNDEKANKPVEAVNDGHQIVFCPNCGKENSAFEPVCTNCGVRLYNNPNGNFAQQPISLPNMQNQNFSTPVIEISPDDIIGDNKVSDVAEYIQLGANRYIPKFYKMEKKGTKRSFNWAAFFFSPYWFFFRKMHVVGFVIMLITLLITGVCTTDRVVKMTNESYEMINQYMEGEISQEEFEAQAANVVTYPEMVVVSVATIAIKVFCGFYGNYFYKKKINDDINEIKGTVSSPEEYRIAIFKRGGISFTMLCLSIVGYTCAEQIMMSLLSR